uniref:Protein kinase domain-containing protein n=1 Tax=viral metagenome TaxID=1070528 RepID=A0A6C0CT97_9ZZZZ
METTLCEEIEKIQITKDVPIPTKKQCHLLVENSYKNPITGRKLDPNAPNGLYRKMVNECKDIQKELDQLAKPKDAPYKPELDIYEDTHKKVLRLRLRNALRKALRPILNHRDTLENRIHYAKVVRTYLNHVQSCIHSSKQNPLKVALFEEKEGHLKEMIYFDRRIGSESVYGTAYLNTGKGLARVLKFSIKIMSDRFTSEVDLLKKMSQLAEKGTSPNMPITYAVKKCITPKDMTLLKNPSAIKLMKTGGYYVVLNELANGDTHDFFKFTYTNREYESVITQMLFALQAFHNLGYVHNDAHLGNFLWHKISPGGFWQYQYNNTIIYVPNTGYLMVLWDPGFAKQKRLPDLYPNIDFYRTIRLLMSISTSKYYQDKNMIGIDIEALRPFDKILYTMISNDLVKSSFIKTFIEVFDNLKLFHHIYYKNKKVNTLPPNSVILNKIPYKL